MSLAKQISAKCFTKRKNILLELLEYWHSAFFRDAELCIVVRWDFPKFGILMMLASPWQPKALRTDPFSHDKTLLKPAQTWNESSREIQRPNGNSPYASCRWPNRYSGLSGNWITGIHLPFCFDSAYCCAKVDSSMTRGLERSGQMRRRDLLLKSIYNLIPFRYGLNSLGTHPVPKSAGIN